MDPIISAGQHWVTKTDDGEVIAVTILGASESHTGAWSVTTSTGHSETMTAGAIIARYRLA